MMPEALKSRLYIVTIDKNLMCSTMTGSLFPYLCDILILILISPPGVITACLSVVWQRPGVGAADRSA